MAAINRKRVESSESEDPEEVSSDEETELEEDCIWVAETTEGSNVKSLLDMFKKTKSVSAFNINQDGIGIVVMPGPDTFYDTILDAEKFQEYYCEIPRFFHIDPEHAHTSLKSVKKKDSIRLEIRRENPDQLVLIIMQKDSMKRHKESIIPIQNARNTLVKPPENYNYPVISASSEYNKMCRELHSVGKVFTVTAGIGWVCFAAVGSSITSQVVLGKKEKQRKNKIMFTGTFASSNLVALGKSSSMSTNIQIYTSPELPLRIQFDIGTLGFMNAYIRSTEQIGILQDSNIEQE